MSKARKIQTDANGLLHCTWPGCGTTTKADGALFETPAQLSGHMARCVHRPTTRQAKIAVERQLRGETVVEGVADPVGVAVQTAIVQARMAESEPVVPQKASGKLNGLGNTNSDVKEDTDAGSILFSNAKKLSPDMKLLVEFQNSMLKAQEQQFEKLTQRLGLSPTEAEDHVREFNDNAHDTGKEKKLFGVIPEWLAWVGGIAAVGAGFFFLHRANKRKKAQAACNREREDVLEETKDRKAARDAYRDCMERESPGDIGTMITTGLGGIAGYAVREGVRNAMRPRNIVRRFGGR